MHVLLIDDHEMFRQGIKLLLTDLDDQVRFSEAGTCEGALEVLGREAIDLILLDLNMPDSDGLSALRDIHLAHPGIPLSVLSGIDDPDLIRGAIDAGASGFVCKASSSEVLVAGLRLILAGGTYLPRVALQGAPQQAAVPAEPVAGPAGAPDDRGGGQLSGRQADVLFKAIQGKPNKIIARELNIAEGTVKAHLSAAYKSLRVRNRTEAVYAVVKLGLQPPMPDRS